MATREKKISGILEALLEGHTIKMDGREWCLCACSGMDEGLLDLAVPAESYDTKTGETGKAYMRTHIRLGDFIAMAERVTDDEFFIICANRAITKMRLGD